MILTSILPSGQKKQVSENQLLQVQNLNDSMFNKTHKSFNFLW